MGRWCEVECNCANRKPLAGSQWWHYSEYCKYVEKPRLAKTAEEFEEKVRGMFECGHRDGKLIEFAPNDLLQLGCALEQVYKKQTDKFEIFLTISQPNNYDDELLTLSGDDVIFWQIEIEQLKDNLLEKEFMEFHEREIFEKEFAEAELLYGSVSETLEDGLRLCEASAKTGNPIRFLL